MKTLYFITVLFLFISCSESKDVTPPSSSNNILSFSVELNGTKTLATIDTTNKTINLSLVSGTDISNLVPTITTSPLSTITPLSGVKQDFSKPVIYTVKAENGNSTSYIVTVSIINRNTDANNTVFIGTFGGTMYALDANTGDKKWSYTVSYGRIGTGAIVSDGILYFGSYDGNNTFFALDIKDGSEKWSFPVNDWIVRDPIISNGNVYFGCSDKNLYALNAKSGSKKWAYLANDKISEIAYSKNVIYFNTGYSGNKTYGVNADNGQSVWSFNLSGQESEITVTDGVIFMPIGTGNRLLALDETTKKILWIFNTNNFSSNMTAPLVSNGVVYFGNNDGTIFAVDEKSGKEKWRKVLGGSTPTSISIDNDILYFGNLNNVYALNSNDGTEKWKFTAGKNIFSDPTIANGTIFFGSDDEKFYALDMNTGSKKWVKTLNRIIQESPCVLTNEGKVYRGKGNIHP